MRKTVLILATASAMTVAAPAFAQDAAADATFSGPRVEAIVGWDQMKAGSSMDVDPATGNHEKIDGLMYGVGVGYDMDLGSAVVGVEGEFTESDAKTKYGTNDFEGLGFGHFKVNRDLYAGVRAGYKVMPNLLVYAKGGYTNAKLDALSSDGTTELKRDFDLDGWRVGAGVEAAIMPHAYAKLEYRYSQYKKAEVDFTADLPDSERFKIDTDRHQVVAAVGWRF